MVSVALGRTLLHLAICSLREGQSRLFSSPPSVVRHRRRSFQSKTAVAAQELPAQAIAIPPSLEETLSRTRAAPRALAIPSEEAFRDCWKNKSMCRCPSLWVGYCFIWPSVHFGRGRAICSVHRLVSFVHRDCVSEHSER